MSFLFSLIKNNTGKTFCNKNISTIDLLLIASAVYKMSVERVCAEKELSKEQAEAFVLNCIVKGEKSLK